MTDDLLTGDTLDEIEARLANGEGADSGGDRWDPEPGETISGVVVDTGVREGGDYGPSPWLDLQTKDGQVRVWMSGKILADHFERKNFKRGDSVGITFDGEKKAKKGNNTYKAYRLVHVPLP